MAKQLVDSEIRANPVMVFSKSYCPYCVKVKNIFENEIKVPADKLKILQIEDRQDCAEIQAYLKEMTGASSVPRVFIKGKFIGGCDDTQKLLSTGELGKLLEEAMK